ncbi:MAG: ParB/RepB/Spo0J family partition protein [Gammaproteobacteria bacterium]|nr:ParB/RepB/Spo0J family partition protein [Gammaproteobacteria bacterium]
MSTKRARLGKGLDALLGGSLAGQEPSKDSLRQLPVDMLQRGRYQPRTYMAKDSLEELASSIKVQGVVQPIVVREVATGGYEIIAGERRWRAAQLAGLEAVPAIVRNVPDEAAMAVSLIENIQREDLNPVEEASGLQRLLDEFGLTRQQVADHVGRSRVAVTNLLRLLTLSERVRRYLEQGKIDMGHARALLGLDAAVQRTAAEAVIAKGLSVRETEQMVRRLQRGTKAPARSVGPDADVRRLVDGLSERIGAKVSIQDRSGKGRLVIEYHSLEELDGIVARIR